MSRAKRRNEPAKASPPERPTPPRKLTPGTARLHAAQASARMAGGAAVIATIGDLLMLYVVSSHRPDLALPAAPARVLTLGAWLGVLTIPLYAVGYRAAAALVETRFALAGRTVFVAGAAGGLLGGIIHGLTATSIAQALASGAAPSDPFQAVAGEPGLIALWAIATVAVVTASVAFAAGVRGREGGTALAWLNPAVLTLGIALIGLPTALSQAFLTPAAPNLAHAIFFALCARTVAADIERAG